MEIGGERIRQGTNKSPIASIITVVRNAGREIVSTLESVIHLRCDDVEYIVIDGDSRDDTLSYIKKYDYAIDYWLSEPDKGIYDAINKGMELARGHYCLVINHGDRLLQIPFTQLYELKDLKADVGIFSVQMSNGRVHRGRVDYRSKFANTIHHQGCFYARQKYVYYDHRRFPHFADFDLNQRLLRSGKKFVEFDSIVSYFSMDGVSSRADYRKEYFKVIRHNFGPWWEFVGRFYIAQGLARLKIATWFNRSIPAFRKR